MKQIKSGLHRKTLKLRMKEIKHQKWYLEVNLLPLSWKILQKIRLSFAMKSGWKVRLIFNQLTINKTVLNATQSLQKLPLTRQMKLIFLWTERSDQEFSKSQAHRFQKRVWIRIEQQRNSMTKVWQSEKLSGQWEEKTKEFWKWKRNKVCTVHCQEAPKKAVLLAHLLGWRAKSQEISAQWGELSLT